MFPVTNTKAVVLPPAVLSELVVKFVATTALTPFISKPIETPPFGTAYKPGSAKVVLGKLLEPDVIAPSTTACKAFPNQVYISISFIDPLYGL